MYKQQTTLEDLSCSLQNHWFKKFVINQRLIEPLWFNGDVLEFQRQQMECLVLEQMESYPRFAKVVLDVLSLFVTTYPCKLPLPDIFSSGRG